MTVVLFIVVLAVLVFAHELGHFLAARSVGVRVSEFGIGFPPRLYTWKPEGSETTYSLNWIPFGGFVKLFKEDEDTGALSPEEFARTLDAKPWYQKVWVLVAGVLFNVLLAWGLITAGLTIGVPMSIDETTEGVVGTPTTMILYVDEASPAGRAGFRVHDAIVRVTDSTGAEAGADITAIQDFIAMHEGQALQVVVQRAGEDVTLTAQPEMRTLEGEERAVIGVVLDEVGIVRYPIWKALGVGAQTTWVTLQSVVVGLGVFFKDMALGDADFSTVAGPVGIAGLTGDAVALGFSALLSFAAMLSLNLAVINLVPFPALDGGRILFALIEAVKGSPVRPSVANTLNIIGFALLMLLMIAITVHDVVKLF